MWEVGRERSVSPRGIGTTGLYWSCAIAAVAAKRIAAAIGLIIRRSPPNPVPDQLRLRVGEIWPALRHAVAGDAGAGDLAVEVGVGRIARRDAEERRQLGAWNADGVRVRLAGRQNLPLLLAEGVVAADRAARRRKDLVLHARERRRRVDRLAAEAGLGRKLLQLPASAQ